MTERQQISRRDVTYIQQYWEPLAAVAWAGHLAQGPGAVVIDRRVQGAPLISYADQTMLVQQGFPKHIPDLLEHLAEYDPASEVVLVVCWEEYTIGYRLRAAELSPPAAYARAQQVPRPLAA